MEVIEQAVGGFMKSAAEDFMKGMVCDESIPVKEACSG